MDELVKRLSNLLTVKSLVTLCLTIVFSVLAVSRQIPQDFMMVYSVVISFYFGTQVQKITTTDTPSADDIANAISNKIKIEVPGHGEEGNES